MAINSYNTKLTIGEKDFAIKDFPSILGARSSLETTTLSDDAQTFIPGIRQQSETFDFTANYDAATYAEINALDGEQDCKLTFGDGSGYSWKGKVSASVNEGSVDSVLEMTIGVTPSTVPVWAQGVGA
jgi:hypothetical protein